LRLTDYITPRESALTSIWSSITREPDQPSKEKRQMTAVTTLTGAFSHKEVDWHAIDWQKAHSTVKRLQARIVKATQAKRWGKVHALQRLLTHSFSGKALAVRRVTENRGKKTPGVDQQLWQTPQKKAQAIEELKRRGYKPSPLRRLYIPKRKGRLRPLSIPTMKDRAMQALYLLALDPVAETTADLNSYGFRSKRSTADAMAQCFIVFRLKQSAPYILEGDIKACFDGISHEWLLAHIPMDRVILRKWLTCGFIDKQILYPTQAGTPQGGPISPTLMNLTLDGLEKRLRESYPSNTRRANQAKVNMIRYADDLLITGSSPELLEQEIKPLVEAFLRERGLELSPEKTRITRIEKGFDFLGQNVRKYNGKLLIKPSRDSVKTLLEKVRAIIKTHKAATAGDVIVKLNPIIKGWASYHRHVVSKRVYSQVDRAIFERLWQWAVRRHPSKGKQWVAKKYFLHPGSGKWVFFGQQTGKDGRAQLVRLSKASSVPIERQIKVKGEANPYDPSWEKYFEERLSVEMRTRLKGKQRLLKLWQQQKGECPRCQQSITKTSGWHIHHKIGRAKGGGDNLGNLVLLHPTCHNQVHQTGLEVVKPRLAKGVR
jgi:RNA-directed DNA polymerase